MRPFGFLLASEPPPRRVGVLVAIVAIALCTLVIYPLKRVVPVVSLGVVYLLAVLVVALIWGAWLGVLAALLSAAAFNFFHLPPVGQFTIHNSENWVALVTFLIAAALASSVAEVARSRAREVDERRREADLAAEMARLLLRGDDLAQALPTVAARLSHVLGLHSAAIEMQALDGDQRRIAFALHEGARRLGTLMVGADTPQASLRRLEERVVPSLEALLGAALEREALLSEVVETASLRRADTVKTAVLRAVSHDLRSPLTAIAAAGEAVALSSLSQAEREELASVIAQETSRLARLVQNLLDQSRLEAGVAEPHRRWTSVDEVLAAALEELAAEPAGFTLSVDSDLPFVRADSAQLERAFVNVLENARRHADGHPVSVRARAVRTQGGHTDRVIVRVADRGPGIPPLQLERVFEPFYRGPGVQGDHPGSGLGLAIARGFVQANGGKLYVESLPGQGATFVFELPLDPVRASPTDLRSNGRPDPAAGASSPYLTLHAPPSATSAQPSATSAHRSATGVVNGR
jgi:two-component system, OmpR family, sensor histidine kinase KdpD